MKDSLRKEILHGGHLQCLGTASIVFISLILFNLKITWHILVEVYLIFYSIYLFDRYKGIEKDQLTNPKRTQYFRKHRKKNLILFFISILVSFTITCLFYNFYGFIFNVFLLIFGLLYPVLFKNITKKVPLFKNIYVSLFFASLVITPFIAYNQKIQKGALILMLFVFLKSMLMQMFLDIKDIESDKKENLKTLGVIIGKEKTLKFLSIFSVFVTLIALALPFPGQILIFTLFLDLFFLKKESYIYFACHFIYWVLLLFIAKIIV